MPSLYASAVADVFFCQRLGLDYHTFLSGRDKTGIGPWRDLFDSTARTLADRYRPIGSLPASWESLSFADRKWFDEAVGLLAAYRVMGAVSTNGATGQVTQVKNANGATISFAAVGPDVRQQWADEAAQAVKRVSVVAAALGASAAYFSPFRVSGPTRSGIAAGASDTIMASVVRLFTDQWYAEGDYPDGGLRL